MAFKKKNKVSGKQTRLNVICHGLMIFWVDASKKRILLSIPHAPGHSYGVGIRGKEQALPYRSHWYLTGVDEGSSCQVNSDERALLDRQYGSLHLDPTKEYCSIEVPMPNEILGFRIANAPSDGFFHGSAQVKYKVVPSSLPMIHVLSYLRVTKPRVEDGKTTLWKGDSQGIQNLHLIAESSFPGEYHWTYLRDAFKNGLDLQVTSSLVSVEGPNLKGMKYGILPSDMKSLQERHTGSVVWIVGGPPPNCMPVFVF